MLKSLDITNFKAWRELQIALGKVTGLFGTNSSGKSSVLQFLLLLKQTKNATDRGLVLDVRRPNRRPDQSGESGKLPNLGTSRQPSIVH